MFGDASDLRVMVRRHGAVLAVEDGAEIGPLDAESTLTKRRARQAFSVLQRRVAEPGGVGLAAEYPAGASAVVARVESGRVVEVVRLPFASGSDDEPGSGVREPRRPPPPDGRSAAASVAPD